MQHDDHLIPLRKMDLEIGKPLRWSVYDARGVLLLRRGLILDSMHKVDVLFDKGLFRSTRRESISARAVAEQEPEQVFDNTFHYRLDRDKGRLIHPVAKLPVGILVSLQANAEDSQDRYVCRYIGYQEEKSVLVSNPVTDGRLVPCRDGQGFFVRCFNGKTALAFKTHIAKANLAPFPYLHLAFPREVEVMKVRASYRAEVDIIATVDINGLTAAVRICNLGFGGAHIQANKTLGETGDSGVISFRIACEDSEVYIKTAMVFRSKAIEDDRGRLVVGYGVQFPALSREHKTLVMNLVYRASVDAAH